MKFGRAVACASVFALANAGVMYKRENEKAGYIKLGFDKVHGRTLESATKEKRADELLVKRADGYGELELTNRNTFYTAELEIGTPKQNMIVVVDTGSSDLWVTGSEVSGCSGSSSSGNDEDDVISSDLVGTATESGTAPSSTFGCSKFGTFNKSKSSTFSRNNTNFYVHYADESAASGPWGTDTISFGNFTLKDASVGVANFSNASVGGILGVGLMASESTFAGIGLLTSNETPYQYENIPAMLASRGLINKNAYSLFLNSKDADTGNILFGAVDHSKYTGTLSTIPILELYRYNSQDIALGFDVTVQGVGATDGSLAKTITTTPFPALLDSGTTLMYIPYSLASLMASQVGAVYSSSIGYYLIECPDDDDPTQFVFDFGGVQINTNLTNYILETTASTTVCVLGIVPMTSGLAIFGDVFLRDAYVVYDLDDMEISLAQANFNGGVEDIEVITSTIPSAVKAADYSNTWSTVATITSGGNIFTLSGSSSFRTTGSASGALSRAKTGATTTSYRVSSSGTARITSTSTTKSNFGERIVPSSFLFMISSFFFSFFL